MDYRITNPSSPWRTVIDSDATPLPHDSDDPSVVGVTVYMATITPAGIEGEPLDDRQEVEEIRCRLTRPEAFRLFDQLRSAIDEATRIDQDLTTPG